MPYLIDRYLKMVHEHGGSDLHLSSGVVPKIRVHGKLRPLKQPPFTAEQLEELILEPLDEKRKTKFLERHDLDWTNVIDNDEAYYLRVYREGDYTYKGADLGVLVTRGRMQTEDRQLRQRAKLWTAAIKRQFVGHRPDNPPPMPTDPLGSKLF